ncbi:hypothetical protein GCM10009630_65940 [Kribbella jejuensis]|uniref:Uncharacterized protein n=1 Tax=Kribbella jejuensis TaxID=236068 RepID=A0A542EP64_9ACTN|nr:hypothetical protein [Kribbella jejuensis]TQJ17109.1 hypothetical protein FB475_1221 [Kribbella jejuensis]
MSSIVPGPKKKLEEEITAARAGAKPLDPSTLNPSAPRPEQLTGLDDWPDSLRTAVEAEHARLTALETNRRKTADRAVPPLVDALDTLLTDITTALGKPSLFTKPAPTPADPGIANFLGIPTEALDVRGSRGDHRTALRTLKQLRTQLKDQATTPDHDRLTRLATFTIRLAVALEAAPNSITTLAPLALTRYTQALPDPQWNKTFPQKLATWKQALTS